MYRVVIEKAVQKQLEKIVEPHYSRVRAAIIGLSENPRPNYRIIYEIADDILTVQVLAAGHRKDIYE
jgi:mRNA interferase RelE/StbE